MKIFCNNFLQRSIFLRTNKVRWSDSRCVTSADTFCKNSSFAKNGIKEAFLQISIKTFVILNLITSFEQLSIGTWLKFWKIWFEFHAHEHGESQPLHCDYLENSAISPGQYKSTKSNCSLATRPQFLESTFRKNLLQEFGLVTSFYFAHVTCWQKRRISSSSLN